MKLKSNAIVTKGMIFAGCSFTWGQGLYYYSNLSTLEEPKPDHYDPNLVRFTHFEFLKSVRYPRLVAHHFNSFEICQPFNGGSTPTIISWWENCFKNDGPLRKSISGITNNPRYDYQDVSHVFFQFTQWGRSHSLFVPIVVEDGSYTAKVTHFGTINDTNFKSQLIEHGMTIDDYIDNAIKGDLEDVKNFLMSLESKGIKTYVLSWPHDVVEYLRKDEWFNKRFISLFLNNVEYGSMEKLMESKKSLTIKTDTDSFEVPPIDHHPSLECHKIVADNIIKFLENNE